MKLSRDRGIPGYFKRVGWGDLIIEWEGGITSDWLYTHTGGVVGPTLDDNDDFVKCDEEGNLKGQDMNKNNNVNYIGGEYKVVTTEYYGDDFGGQYNFKIDVDTEVKEGDMMVVEAKSGLGIVRCLTVLKNCMENAKEVKKATAWVVQVLDLDRQKARKEATERRAYVIQQLEERKSQVEAINMYAMLAEVDPEAKKLLEELKTID